MGVIQVLSDRVANQIAAGEAIERPAAVVKELLENALDAGATRLRIAVAGGGRDRIQVSDDGCGMVRDDALLALERHATSKLRDVEGLNAIATLGFRGEALPSIAAVSQFTLETAPAAGGVGTRLQAAGGKLGKVEAVGLPPGTAVTVARLFFNLPPRRKFLKSEATELGHITTLVTNYALAYPEIQFHLETEHRELLALPPAATPRERLDQVFGAATAGQMVEFHDLAQWPACEPAAGEEREEAALGGLGLHGFASRPELHRLNRNSIFTFVNRRLVRDKVLQHALGAAYANLLPNLIYPAVLLFVDLPYAEVDVNVHPAKTEVRFRRQSFVHDAVRDAIRRALGAQRPLPSFLREVEARPSAAPALTLTPPPRAPQPQRLAFAPGGAARPAPGPDWGGVAPAAAAPPCVPETRAGCAPAAPAPAAPREDREELEQLAPLGQIAASFIVAAGPGGLWLVDQHAAHERVLFERIEARRLAGEAERQMLLLPRVIELDAGRMVAFADLAPELAAMGFEAEPFGVRTVIVKSAPAGIGAEQTETLLQELLETAAPEERRLTLDDLRRRIAATIACHAAIKVNMPLDQERMSWLLHAVAATQYPMTCPHGRPVLLRYRMEEILQAFKRIR